MTPRLLAKDIMHLGEEATAAQNTISFVGKGIAVYGNVRCSDANYVARLEVSIDGRVDRIMELPAAFLHRTADVVYWNYDLPDAHHTVSFRLLNPQDGVDIQARKIIGY